MYGINLSKLTTCNIDNDTNQLNKIPEIPAKLINLIDEFNLFESNVAKQPISDQAAA